MIGEQRYLLDTNVLSALIKDPHGVAARRIAKEGEDRVCTSIIVACELRFGAEKQASSHLSARVRALLWALEVLPFEAPADLHYASLRRHLEKAGTPIGPNDMLVAAHAQSLGAAVVTANVREFSRVPGLIVENWLD